MTKEQVLSLLKETAAMREILDRIDEARRFEKTYGQSGLTMVSTLLGVEEAQVDQVIENAVAALPKLKAVLLELPADDAKEVMQIALKDDDCNNILVRILNDERTSWSEKIALQKLIFPDEAEQAVTLMLQQWIDTANAPLAKLGGLVSRSVLESEDFKKVREELDKSLQFYVPLKRLHDRKVVSDEIVGLALDAFHLRRTEYLEKLSEALSRVITEVDDLDALENIATVWNEVLPDSLSTKLTKMYLGTSEAKIRENIKNAIILMGKNPLQLLQGGDFIMEGGKKYEVRDNVGGFMVFDGTAFFNEIAHNINIGSGLDQTVKDELEKLSRRLAEELAQVPNEQAEDAKAVAELTKDLVEKASKEQPNKPLIKITADGLLKAAENIEKIAPKVIVIAKQIVALLLT